MKRRDLKIVCTKETMVEVWVDLYTPEDIDDLILWLKLAKDVMLKWEKINAKDEAQS